MQGRRNASALAMELRLSCTNPLIRQWSCSNIFNQVNVPPSPLICYQHIFWSDLISRSSGLSIEYLGLTSMTSLASPRLFNFAIIIWAYQILLVLQSQIFTHIWGSTILISVSDHALKQSLKIYFYNFWPLCSYHLWVNILFTSATIRCLLSWSTLVQVMACCQTEPNHYLSQWLPLNQESSSLTMMNKIWWLSAGKM